ncbi:MAG TPA: flagellar biosynthesis anti-sigma factor FlgM [Longimicrobiaceae bacterium]
MKIHNPGSEILRSGYAQGSRGSTEGAARPVPSAQPVAPASRGGDRVEISEAGRALAARQADNLDARVSELTPERVEEIRQRILEGAYNSIQVVDTVARRMLERGDI